MTGLEPQHASAVKISIRQCLKAEYHSRGTVVTPSLTMPAGYVPASHVLGRQRLYGQNKKYSHPYWRNWSSDRFIYIANGFRLLAQSDCSYPGWHFYTKFFFILILWYSFKCYVIVKFHMQVSIIIPTNHGYWSNAPKDSFKKYLFFINR